jgi:tol-pal system protein YbgF
MIHAQKRTLAFCVTCLLPLLAGAAAPVVDESANYAMAETNQAASMQPLAKEQPLAHDNDIDTRLNSRKYSNAPDRDYPDERPIARDTTPHMASNDNASLLNTVQSLQQQVQELRGQLEMQTHDMKILQEQQLSFYKDLDARIRHEPVPTQQKPINTTGQYSTSLPAKAAASIPKPRQASSSKVLPVTNNLSQNNPAEEQIRYLAAFDLVKSKRTNEAITAMQSFAVTYPNGGYTANAHYWLGELYLIQKDFPKAVSQFDTVLKQFPSSSKSAPSLLKMGYALAASGKKQDAILRLTQVVKKYPDTKTAQLAESKLKTLIS